MIPIPNILAVIGFISAFIDTNECNTNNGGCQHSCINTAGSYQCWCNSGYRLSTNGKSCIGKSLTMDVYSILMIAVCMNNLSIYMYKYTSADVNECNRNNGRCHHICVNTEGSYECQCIRGYRLSSNGRTCRGTQTPFHIFSKFIPIVVFSRYQ